jgi:hypothetical protein
MSVLHFIDSILTFLVYKTSSVSVFICCLIFLYCCQKKLWIITSYPTLTQLFHYHWTICVHDTVSGWVIKFLFHCAEGTLKKHLLLTLIFWASTYKTPKPRVRRKPDNQLCLPTFTTRVLLTGKSWWSTSSVYMSNTIILWLHDVLSRSSLQLESCCKILVVFNIPPSTCINS